MIDEIKGLGDDVVARDRLELGHVDASEQGLQPKASGVGGPPGRAVSASRVSNTTVPPFFMKAAMRATALGAGCGRPATTGQ